MVERPHVPVLLDAVRECASAAAGEVWVDCTLGFGGHSAAFLEAGEWSACADLASQARELAFECRHTFFEARAVWLLRSARYRAGELEEPDVALIEAARQLPARWLLGLLLLNEASVAWRAGELVLAESLALEATEVWRQINQPWPALLAEALLRVVQHQAPG